jgi:hypothetical protein
MGLSTRSGAASQGYPLPGFSTTAFLDPCSRFEYEIIELSQIQAALKNQ